MREAVAAHLIGSEGRHHAVGGVGKADSLACGVEVECQQGEQHLGVGLGGTEVAGARAHLGAQPRECGVHGALHGAIARVVGGERLDGHGGHVDAAVALRARIRQAGGHRVHELPARPCAPSGGRRPGLVDHQECVDELVVGTAQVRVVAHGGHQVGTVEAGDVLTQGGERQAHALGLGGGAQPRGAGALGRGDVAVEHGLGNGAAGLQEGVELPLLQVLVGILIARGIQVARGAFQAGLSDLLGLGGGRHAGDGDRHGDGLGAGGLIDGRAGGHHGAGLERRHRVVAGCQEEAVVGGAGLVLPGSAVCGVDAHHAIGAVGPGEARLGNAVALAIALTGVCEVERGALARLEGELAGLGLHALERVLVGVGHIHRGAQLRAVRIRIGQRGGEGGGAGLIGREADIPARRVRGYGGIARGDGEVAAVARVVRRHDGARLIREERESLGGERVAPVQQDGLAVRGVSHLDARGSDGRGGDGHALGAGTSPRTGAHGDLGGAGALEREARRVGIAVEDARVATLEHEAREARRHILAGGAARVVDADLEVAHLGTGDADLATGHVLAVVPDLEIIDRL